MIHYSVAGKLAKISLNRPPVNALDEGMRSRLMELLRRAESDSSITAILICSDLPIFCAGADIREFRAGHIFGEPGLPTLCQYIEEIPKNVVIAIDGIAMGGAVELALACDYRIASRGATLGLPEIKLGLMPGAGGTQRLPRITNLQVAAQMILTGEAVSAEQAYAAGLIDELFESEEDFARLSQNFANTLIANENSKRPGCSMLSVNTSGYADYLDDQKDALMTPEIMQPARLRALKSLDAACHLSLQKGLEQELQGFLELLETPEAQELIKRFFAHRGAGKHG